MRNRNESGLSIPFLINLGFILVLLLYLVVMVLLLLAELEISGFQWLRATNQVLILLALLFLPFLVLASSRLINSISISSDKVSIQLAEGIKDLQLTVKEVKEDLSKQVSTAEQALWTILAGDDYSSTQRWEEKKLVIGSKEDTSQVFFAHFLAEWLKRNVEGLQECELRIPNGGSLKNFADLKYRWIDLYIDYTGTCCQFFNINHRGKHLEQIIDELNRHGQSLSIRWLNPLGATEDYCLVMKAKDAQRHNVTSIPDLVLASSNLVLSADPEFLNRKDCFLGLESQYGLKFKRIEPCHVTERYAMLGTEEAVVFVGYETDPELQSPDLIVLEDVEGFFPTYDAIPIIQTKIFTYIDGLEMQLLRLHNAMTTRDLILQVMRLSSHKVAPQRLAQEFCDRIEDRIRQIEAIEAQFEQKMATDPTRALTDFIKQQVNIRDAHPQTANELTKKLQAKLRLKLQASIHNPENTELT